MILLQLFLSFAQVGLFSIGGGYAAMPLIQSQVVDHYGWLSMSVFTDLVTIAEMTPGPIVINAATFVGIRVAGAVGAIVATLGCILPSCLIVSLLAYVYYRYQKMSVLQSVLASLRPAVVAMIASAGLSLLILSLYGQRALPAADLSGINFISAGIFAVALFVLRRWKISPVWVMLGAGAAGVLLYSIF